MRVGREIALEPPIDEMIPAGVTFALMGSQDQVRRFARATGIDLARGMEEFVEVLNPSRAGVSEVVIPPASSVAGRTIRQAGMRKRYGAHVLAIYRQEEVIRHDLSDTELQVGDTLVLHSFWDDLHRLTQDRSFVVVTDYPYEVTRPHRVYHALAFFLLAIGLVLFTDLRLSLAASHGRRGHDPERRHHHRRSVPLGGLAECVPARRTASPGACGGDHGHRGVDRARNTPAARGRAALGASDGPGGAHHRVHPADVERGRDGAAGAARDQHRDWCGRQSAVFALTVALAASNSFLIPTHQVNALVMGPGGYGVADFMRAGGVMTILFLVILIPMVNLIF